MVAMRAFLALLLLTGCSHSAVVVGNARAVAPSGTVTMNATGGFAAAVLIGTAAVAASQGPVSETVPAMAPEREIGEQDCTQPIDLTAGNLRCR